jgi:signal transduction histidine kinase
VAQETLVRSERLAAIGELASAVGHELRNPLGVITINGAMLMRWSGPDAAEKIRAASDKILRAARRLNDQLGEALDAVKVERGELRVERTTQAVRGLIARAVDVSAPSAAQRNIELAALPVADDLRAACDEARVLQVLAIAIDRLLRSSTPPGRITVGAALAGDLVRFEVADPEAVARGVLHPGSAGSNLRLALARGVVEAHGCALSLAPGAVSFTLPAASGRV